MKVTKLRPFGLLLEEIEDFEIESIREFIKENQLIVLRGKSFDNADSFSQFCENLGELALWPFGTVLELEERGNPEDHIFDHKEVPLHWDGMFRETVPELQVFFCRKAPKTEEGGRTIFSNTKLFLERARAEEVRRWKSVIGLYRRKMEFYESSLSSPLVANHPVHGYPILRFGEIQSSTGIINPAEINFKGLPLNEIQALTERLYSEDFLYTHEWKVGDVVIADNFSLLHGRERFKPSSPRHLQRVHVQMNPPFQNPGLGAYL